MFVATLICSPRERTLDGALVAALRDAWGGAGIRWLSPDEAAEFEMPRAPGDASQVWADLDAQGIDLIVQPGAGRRKRMLIADMDSTMIRQECIDELAAEAGFGPRVAEITARAMNGELDFESALTERVALLKGLPEQVIEKVLDERITYMPGGYELVATMKAQGAHCVLVSGGFTAFAARVGAALGFHEVRANTLLAADGLLTGEVARPILGRDAKFEALEEIRTRLDLDREDVIAVGDGMNDLLMLANAGIGVALHGKPALQARCDVRVNHGDLTALLFLQGYARDEFVT